MKKETDWTSYYKKKKSFFSKITQKSTLKYLISYFNLIENEKKCIKTVEMGGGNSCFAEELIKRLPFISQYDIIDNNIYAVELYNKKQLGIKAKGSVMDLSGEIDITDKYDFVYSVGLIEHFDNETQRIVIKNHFEMCKDGGYVLLTFPTPTLKYRVCRKIMEGIGVWQFYDEVPLFVDKIKDDLLFYGKIIDLRINRKLALTQSIVLIKKKNTNE